MTLTAAYSAVATPLANQFGLEIARFTQAMSRLFLPLASPTQLTPPPSRTPTSPSLPPSSHRTQSNHVILLAGGYSLEIARGAAAATPLNTPSAMAAVAASGGTPHKLHCTHIAGDPSYR